MARKFGVPELLYGHTDEYKQESDADNPDDDKTADDIGKSLKVGEVEYSVVHQQHAKFCPDKIVNVENFSHEQELCHHDDVVWGNFVCVYSHALGVHPENEAYDKQVPSLHGI